MNCEKSISEYHMAGEPDKRAGTNLKTDCPQGLGFKSFAAYHYAGVTESADVADSKSVAERRVGSSPTTSTKGSLVKRLRHWRRYVV